MLGAPVLTADGECTVLTLGASGRLEVAVPPTYWFVTVRANGNFELYSLPDFTLPFLAPDFPHLPDVLSDATNRRQGDRPGGSARPRLQPLPHDGATAGGARGQGPPAAAACPH
jgi:hypothetical protein